MPIYTDLNLSFKKHPGTKDVLKKTDVEAVKTALKNLLLGNPFDTPFDPHYGAGFRGLLFELLSPSVTAATKRNVYLKIAEYEPRCVVENLLMAEGENSLDVELLFYVIGNEEQQQLNFVLERVR